MLLFNLNGKDIKKNNYFLNKQNVNFIKNEYIINNKFNYKIFLKNTNKNKMLNYPLIENKKIKIPIHFLHLVFNNKT